MNGQRCVRHEADDMDKNINGMSYIHAPQETILLPSQMPQLGDKGLTLDVSQRCYNRSCVLADHIVLETHRDNIARRQCRRLGFCTEQHLNDNENVMCISSIISIIYNNSSTYKQ